MFPLQPVYQHDFDFTFRQPNEQTTTKKPIIPVTTHNYKIGETFYPLVLLARCVGCCPVTIAKRKEKTIYEFKFSSIVFLITLAYILFTGFMMITWTVNGFFDERYPVRL